MISGFYDLEQMAGIAVHTTPTGEQILEGCLLRLQGGQLHTVKKFIPASLEDLGEYIATDTLIALNLTGKSALVKKLITTTTITEENFSQVLPNANLADFYIQQTISGSQSYAALIRKTEADKWFNELTSQGYRPVVLSLGPFPLINLLGETNFYGESVVFNGHVISRNANGEWLDYQYDSTARADYKIKLQAEMMEEQFLLPYAAAFQVLLSRRIDMVKTDATDFEHALAMQLSLKKFKTNSLGVLLLFFVLLLINFFTFSSLESANEKLSEQLSRTQQNAQVFQFNANHIKEKELLLQQLGWDANKYSNRLDQLAALLPPGIKLTSITVNPPDIAAGQLTKSLVFSSRQIKVSGLSEKVLAVNEWLARLKTKPWIKNGELDNYAYNNEQNTGFFSLTIRY